MCFKYDHLMTHTVTGKHHSYSVRCSLSCRYGDQNLQQKSSAVLPTAAINELEFLATLVQLRSGASAGEGVSTFTCSAISCLFVSNIFCCSLVWSMMFFPPTSSLLSIAWDNQKRRGSNAVTPGSTFTTAAIEPD